MNTDSRKELIPDIKQLLDNPIPQPESNSASSSSSELNVATKTNCLMRRREKSYVLKNSANLD